MKICNLLVLLLFFIIVFYEKKITKRIKEELKRTIQTSEMESLVSKSKIFESQKRIERLEKKLEDNMQYTFKVGEWVMQGHQESLDLTFEKEVLEKKLKFLEDNLEKNLWDSLNEKFEEQNPSEDFFEE